MEEHLANLKRRYELLEKYIKDIEILTPEKKEELRGFRYDIYWDVIDDAEPVIEKEQEYIKKQKDILQEQQELIYKINILYNKLKKMLNEIQIGDLQKIANETIKTHNVSANKGDEIGQNVLNLYNEAEYIEHNRGGKKRRIKNTTHKKIKRKNKKSRRFFRNK